MLRIRDLLYLVKHELRDAVVERYARPLRERVAELERDNHQLHLAVAHDVTRANTVINAARAVVECEEDIDRTQPCCICLERLYQAVETLDGKDRRALGKAAKHHG